MAQALLGGRGGSELPPYGTRNRLKITLTESLSNAQLARSLARRLAGEDRVRVVHGDLLRVPLPQRRYLMVSNIPFATGSALLHRLLDHPATPLAGADLDPLAPATSPTAAQWHDLALLLSATGEP